MWKQDMPTLCRNVDWTAYQSTPGALIKDYDTNGAQFERPTTVPEAEKVRPEFDKHAQEFKDRNPDSFAAWCLAYDAWRAGDTSTPMLKAESFLAK
jgi:hypothetical protein